MSAKNRSRKLSPSSNKITKSVIKKIKMTPELESTAKSILENVGSSSNNNDDNINSDENSSKNANPQPMSEKKQGKLPEQPNEQPKVDKPVEFKHPSWDELVSNEMDVEKDDNNISVSS